MGAYYNEFDPKAAQWLRQLIKNDVIADGEVDERSIIDVQADDLRGFTQHHFFAGIGGWSYALRLAGWDDTRPVCTASLPCQPFSVAGAQKGVDDERHLLPHFIELVKQCNFQTIFGEQVPGAIKHGWLDDLCTEMERESYSVGQIVLTAAGEGAPHIRQRLYWVADSNGKQRQQRSQQMERGQAERIGSNSIDSIMADSINKGSQGRLSGWQDTEREVVNRHSGCSGTVGRVSNTENGYGGGESQLATSNGGESWDQFGGDGSCSGLGNTKLHGHDASQIGRSIGESKTESRMLKPEGSDTEWSDPDWLYCRDEKYRPIKPSIEPLANGLPRGMGYSSDPSESIDADNTQEARVMRLKGYGNAIVPQVASSFIKAFMQC
jgi:DNA (cytosine-5)-methyltransferase 1